MNNITYLFGAGASYHACPIWKEQAKKMIELPKRLGHNFTYREGENNNFTDDNSLVWLIGYIGTKAKEFNTVDTYAKKLYLQNNITELNQLKAAVSCFFTIWSLTNQPNWKYRGSEGNMTFYKEIDHRYMNLLATYLEKGVNQPRIRDKVKFVSWNYDLQIEKAYLKFTDITKDRYEAINKHFPFIPTSNTTELDVCHLNGFHGYYGKSDVEHLFGNSNTNDISKIISSINFVIPELRKKKLSFNNHINYAWESDSEISSNSREIARRIYAATNILVVIGYSFPPFNHEIDKMLFKSIVKLDRLIIQDPNADAKFISETFGIDMKIINVVNNVDQFVIPNYTEIEKKRVRVM